VALAGCSGGAAIQVLIVEAAWYGSLAVLTLVMVMLGRLALPGGRSSLYWLTTSGSSSKAQGRACAAKVAAFSWLAVTSQTGPWRYSGAVQGWRTFQLSAVVAVGPASARGRGAPGRKQSPCPMGLDERFDPHLMSPPSREPAFQLASPGAGGIARLLRLPAPRRTQPGQRSLVLFAEMSSTDPSPFSDLRS
jgi:hypothetical protein